MQLSQIQIIKSLGESMSWLKKEISWGVQASELRHLVGRIGELYAAVITNSQMATQVNQKGYDIISTDNERISVKTKTSIEGAGFVSFNPNTLDIVDRVIILHLDIKEQEINILFNDKKEKAESLMNKNNSQSYTIAMSKLRNLKAQRKKNHSLLTTKEAFYKSYHIKELETGSIQVFKNGQEVNVVKPILREVASLLNLSIYNSNGNKYTTRQLGSIVIKDINSRVGSLN